MSDETEEEKEWAKQYALRKAEYDKLMKQDKGYINLIEKIEPIKSNWFLWTCTRDDVMGSVQADYTGDLIAHETFEADE